MFFLFYLAGVAVVHGRVVVHTRMWRLGLRWKFYVLGKQFYVLGTKFLISVLGTKFRFRVGDGISIFGSGTKLLETQIHPSVPVDPRMPTQDCTLPDGT